MGVEDPPDPSPEDGPRSSINWFSDGSQDGACGGNPPPNTLNNWTGARAQENFTYTCQDSPPYRVYMELKDKNRKINKYTVGLMIRKHEEFRRYVTDMKYTGARRIMVFLSSYEKANQMIEALNVADSPYRAYIPRHLVAITGVISGIPEDISEEEILDGIDCDVPVLGVRRLTRTAEKIPTTRVSVSFRANQLPDYVRLFCCKSNVRPFYQRVVICTRCLRFNHRENNCKGRKRCERCTEEHQTNEEYAQCQRRQKCANCGSSQHTSKDNKCPEKERQSKIKGLMAKRNITYTEAREIVPIASENIYEPLNHLEEYPVLAESFASMAGGNYKWKDPLRAEWIKTNLERKAVKAAIEIEKEKKEQQKSKPNGKRQRSDMKDNNQGMKAQRITEERDKIVSQSNSSSIGTGLSNRHAVDQHEKWQNALRQAREKMEAKAQAEIKAAEEKHHAELMNFYADYVAKLGNDEIAKAHFNECTNKHFDLAKTVIQSAEVNNSDLEV